MRLHRCDRKAAIFNIPLLHVSLGDLRAAERVIAVRMQRSDLFRADGQMMTGQLCSGRTGEARDEHPVGLKLLRGTPNLSCKLCGLSRARWTEDSIFGCN